MTDVETDRSVSRETTAGTVTIRTDHPGGNGRLLGVEGETVRLEPEIRDSTRQWFYWNVELESDVAQTLRIEFPHDEVVGPRGPAVRSGVPCGGPIGAGAWSEWTWLGADSRVDATAFRYTFDAGEEVQFALSAPYQRADFDAFAFEYEADPRLTIDSLGQTADGRDVPVVRLGSGDRHVALAARHHACESPGSYVLEGVLRGLLEDGTASDTAALLDTYRFHVYPFGDPDGVERGDPGKHRAPHDHNRDYLDSNAIADLSPIYASTAAIAADLRSLGELAFALDLHAPHKWGGDINDRPFFVRDPSTASDRLCAFAETLAETTQSHGQWTSGDDQQRTVDRTASTGGDRYLTYDSTPGVGVATFAGQSGLCHTFTRYCSQFGADPSVALEIPYVGTTSDPVIPETARRFGRDLATAIDRVFP